MNADGNLSALSAFCAALSERAAGKDFIFVASEETAEKELKDLLPFSSESLSPSIEGAVMSAAGFALAGRKPWLIGRAADIAGRCYSRIREAIVQTGLPVRIVSFDGGISCVHEGASSHMIEAGDEISCPFYMRLDGAALSQKYENASEPFHIGGARILRGGGGVTICACGAMVARALKAAERLEMQNINAEVIDCYSLKPFAENVLLSSVRRTGCCVAASEENAFGGLFGAVAECLGRTYPVPLRSVAVGDEFVNSGTQEELCEYYGLTWKEIVDAAAQVWALRRR